MIETLREQLRASQELTNTSATFEGGPAPKLADLQAQVNIVGLVTKQEESLDLCSLFSHFRLSVSARLAQEEFQ